MYIQHHTKTKSCSAVLGDLLHWLIGRLNYKDNITLEIPCWKTVSVWSGSFLNDMVRYLR